MKNLETNPYKGKPLGKKGDIDLTGYYKLYVMKKKVRIVYTVLDNEITVEVITIGKREESKVYKEAFKRISGYDN